MTEINVDLNDPRTLKIADAISNKTCKKILEVLAEKGNLSETDLSNEIGVPINTIGYNIKKLVSSGLVEKSKTFFWSVKGKRIPTYRVSNKKIVISPKRFQKGIVPALLISGLVAIGIKLFNSFNKVSSNTPEVLSRSNLEIMDYAAEETVMSAADSAGSAAPSVMAKAAEISSDAFNSASSSGIEPWTWFLIGAWFSLVIIVLWSYIRPEK